jgi:EpsI family protein
MIKRRDMIIAALCLGAAGAAQALKPRGHLSLLGRRQVGDIVPRSFGDWTSQDVGGLVAPKVEGSLADRLYNQIVERIYSDGAGNEIMVLMAHGQSNTDSLQLHRPESCYPAFGFTLTSNTRSELRLASNIEIPVRQLVAEAPGRRENIIYWARLGEFLPLSRAEQRDARLMTAMQGFVADGLLARFSLIGDDSPAAMAVLRNFIPQLLYATNPKGRDALIGTERAKAMVAKA